uniref:Uncharacterized protein n=1 Tax=Aegilops tauschii subsp. strangulata TaxID=200361 RepID=A0A453NQM7_AEGTS
GPDPTHSASGPRKKSFLLPPQEERGRGIKLSSTASRRNQTKPQLHGDGGDGHLEAPAGRVRRRVGQGRAWRRRGAAPVLPAAHPRPAAPDPPEDAQPQSPRGPAQRPQLPRVRMLREELQLLQEPGSYVGEVVKVMGKSKVLVK